MISRRIRPVAALALGAALALPAHAVGEATRAVVKALEAKDCAAAVRELNSALATSAPEAFLLGGSMFEQGLCLKPNLERASRLYMRAADTGAASAHSRLAALYAAPAAGPDKGAAIWWGLQAGLPLPSACVVPPDRRGDAEGFAKFLGAWPVAQLDACVHVTGVLATLDAEYELKPESETGDGIAFDFQPASGKLDLSFAQLNQEGKDSRARYSSAMGSTQRSYARDPSPDQLQAMQAEAAKREFAEQIEGQVRDALVRFPRPAGVDPAWRIRVRVESGRAR